MKSGGKGKQSADKYRCNLLKGCRPQIPTGTDVGATVLLSSLRRLLADPDSQGDGAFSAALRKSPILPPLDRLDFRYAWAAPAAGNRMVSRSAVSPPIIWQNRRHAGACPTLAASEFCIGKCAENRGINKRALLTWGKIYEENEGSRYFEETANYNMAVVDAAKTDDIMKLPNYLQI